MKRLLFFLMAMIFAIQGWTQTLNESFEGATFPPEEWTTATTAGSGTWQSSTGLFHTGAKSAKSAYQSGGTTRWLITPKLSVTSDVTNFAFWIATDYWFSDGDDIEIFVSTTDNQTSSFSTTALLSLTEDSVTTTWAQHSVDLSSYVGQDIYVAIRVTDNYGFHTFIDDVTGPNLYVPSCPKPSVLTYSNIGALNADISWTETGTASQWTIEYKPSSETSWANAISSSASATTYSLTNLTGNTLYNVRVKAVCVSGTSESDWRTGSFTTPYSCPAPTSLSVPASGITTTDALVKWNPTINPVNWNEGYLLQYKPSSVSDWNLATSISAIQDTFYLLQGLNPSTGYSVRLKSVCNPGVDSSSWTSTANFSTLCVPISTFPWAESFEGLSAANTFPNNCWSATNLGSKTGTQNTNYNSYNRNARTGTGAAWFKYGCNDSFKTPSFQFAANTSYDFSFWYVTDGLGGWNTLRAELWDATTNTLVDTLGSQVNNPANTNYSLYTSSFTVPNENDSYYVSIYCQSTSAPWYLTIDDISVEPSPTCPSAYNLSSSIRSSTSVDLNWMQNGNGSGWVIAYGDTTGFDPSTATQTLTVSSTDPIPYTVTNLTPQTPYSFAVRQNCANGAWSNIVSVITPANATTLPYSHSFEDVTENNAWSFINGTQTNQWVIGTAADTLGATGLYISNDQGVTNAYTGGSSNLSRVYAYRDFEVPAGAGELELSFDWRAKGGSAQTDFLRMYLVPLDANITAGNNPPNGLDASAQIGNYTGGTGEHWLSQSTVWQHKTMRINSAQFPNLAGRTWRLLVHWRNESNTTTGIQPPAAVDNINLSVVTCASPSALAASNITTTSALLTWNENGSATNWIIEYKPTSATTWSTYQTTNRPDSIINLIPGTSYTARLRSLCTDTSLYSNSITFQTVCAAQTVPTPVEGFLTVVPPTTCWSRMQGDLPATGNATLTSTTSGWYWNSNVTPHNAMVEIYTSSWYPSPTNYWLISPSVDLGDGTIPAQIEFDVFYTAAYSTNAAETGGTDDRFAVVVSTDDGLTWDAANATIWSNATGATRVLDNITNVPTHIILPLFDPATTLPYTGNIKIGFYGESTVSNADNSLHIDNFEVLPYTTCQKPTSIIASNITSTDANVSFTENGSSTSWEYVYGDASTITDPTTGTAVTSTTNPIQLTGLTPQTQYNIWVRSICDNSHSEWSTISTFVTEALPVTLPYSQNFEDATLVSEWMFRSSNATHTDMWHVGAATGNTGNSMYVSSDGGATNSYTQFSTYTYASVLVNFGQSAEFSLSFDWKGVGESGYDKFSVYTLPMSSPMPTTGYPTGGATLLSPIGSQATWQNLNLILPSATYANTTQRLIFVWYSDGSTLLDPPSAVDNIVITGSDCGTPTGLVASNITATTTDLAWTEVGTATSWYLYYKPTTSTDYDSVLVTTNQPYTLSNLTANTSYNIYVKADCGSEYSNASSVVNFRTACDAIASFPWTESFESITAEGEMPTCMAWTGSTGTVKTYLTSTDHNRSARTGNKYLSYSWSCDNYVYTPVFTLQAGTSYDFSFWYKADGATGYGPLEASLMSSQSSTSVLSPIGTPIPANIQNTTYTQYQGTFTPDANGNYYIGIHVVGTSNPWYLTIDDLSLDLSNATPCSDPTSVLVSNVGTTTADVAWTAGGSETSWEVRLGTTGTPVSVTSPTYQLTGLTQGTNYTVYVRANCGTGYSAWVASAPFTTLAVVAPTVVTNAASLVSQTSATLNGTITIGSEPITAKGFDWRVVGTTTWNNQPVTTGTLTYNLSSLIANTSYEYRAYATTTTTTYGSLITFTTLPNAVTPPTVVTSPVSNLAQTSVTLNGTVTQGAESITTQGFEWKLASATTWTRVPVIGTLTLPLSSLTANTSYQCRAYAETPTAGYTYGATVNFITLPILPPSVVTTPATNITQTSAVLNGTATQGTNPILTQGFEWRLANTTAWTQVPVTGALTYTLPGLTASTTYEFRAYATTSIDTTNGLILNFTTLAIPVVLGDVTTLGATNIEDHSAILNGTLVSVGNALSNVKVGFVYSTMANPEIGGTNVIIDTVPYIVGMTSFNKPILGLQSNTSYFCKAYVTNSAGTQYGLEETFITLGLVNPESEGFSVSMYPNPATSTTKLVVSGVVGEAKIVISDVQGRIINTINAKSVNGVVEQTIDVNNLAKGVYYVRIQNATTSRTQKLIVQ
jgi:hypothetical protein